MSVFGWMFDFFLKRMGIKKEYVILGLVLIFIVLIFIAWFIYRGWQVDTLTKENNQLTTDNAVLVKDGKVNEAVHGVTEAVTADLAKGKDAVDQTHKKISDSADSKITKINNAFNGAPESVKKDPAAIAKRNVDISTVEINSLWDEYCTANVNQACQPSQPGV